MCFVPSAKGQKILQHPDIAALKEFNKELLSENKMTLLVFLATECPLSKNYSVVIQKIADEFAQELQVTAIIPGSTDSKKEVRAFAVKYKLDFPLLIDKKMISVHAVHATTTPEVVLLSPKGELIYQGAIDDWAVDLGKKRNKPDQEYLRNAILQAKSGLPVLVNYNEPVGCLINDF
ncbi:redoxin domain-containing protein [Flavihumibacter sp. RY-1]|uniref:Redoxin domain-containing protein n=1 Tax=Flavihumibacter fluminis TaxID=2909236 RepID=A0ABS9BI80_9BACT|nr:redoxin domain-containing protein [Flavihumibacter fluminis]MCF1714549.1 redoxin domain-containing protein [Flavihumibacter fluminis]